LPKVNSKGETLMPYQLLGKKGDTGRVPLDSKVFLSLAGKRKGGAIISRPCEKRGGDRSQPRSLISNTPIQ